ncbi:UNVERIFIED_CONTAM: hypothetical protein GTU68_023580, partial [Idotea baltica]|nr:hypothetical protein [Idotea baltica]
NQLFNHIILLIGTLIFVGPIALIFFSASQPSGSLSANGLQFFWGGEFWTNFARVFTYQAGFTDSITWGVMMKNSLIVGFGTAILTTVFSLLTAYALVFFKLRGANFLFWLIFMTLLFPLESRFIPTYAITSDLGLLNTHLGIILPTLALALGTFFFRQYFLTIPNEFIEAARLDGAGPIRFLIDIVAPLSWARAGAIFTIAFMIGWNQYLWPLMISSDESLYTLVRGSRLMGQISGPGMALIVLTILPPLLLLIMFQRWFFASLVQIHSLDE